MATEDFENDNSDIISEANDEHIEEKAEAIEVMLPEESDSIEESVSPARILENGEPAEESPKSDNETDPETPMEADEEEKEPEKADTEAPESDAEEFHEVPKGERTIDFLFDIIEIFIFSLAAVLVMTTFLFRHSVVEGSSMENTLHEGEHLLISDLFYTPKRGDIIVCEDYQTNLRKPIVKRVIGLPGDHVVVTEEYEVYINGELLEEDYAYFEYINPLDSTADIIVPEGEIFIMGDHRNMSTDSRYFGTVDMDSVLGRVLLRFYPFERFEAFKRDD